MISYLLMRRLYVALTVPVAVALFLLLAAVIRHEPLHAPLAADPALFIILAGG